MNSDSYTKAMLTLIAICLVWLSIYRLLEPERSYAQQQIQRVVLAGVQYDVNGTIAIVPFKSGTTPAYA